MNLILQSSLASSTSLVPTALLLHWSTRYMNYKHFIKNECEVLTVNGRVLTVS